MAISIDDLEGSLISEMDKVLEVFFSDIASGLRTGSITPAVMDSVVVNAYGSDTRVSRVSNVSLVDRRTLMIKPWDNSLVDSVKDAIMALGIASSVSVESGSIRLVVPELSAESRKQNVKLLNKMAESARVIIRNIRRKYSGELKDMNHDKLLSDDEYHKFLGIVGKITDEKVGALNKTCAAKELEISKT